MSSIIKYINNSIICHMYLLNVGIPIGPQIEDAIREPATSSELIIHEVGLITSHLLINMLFIDTADGDPVLTAKGTARYRRNQKL